MNKKRKQVRFRLLLYERYLARHRGWTFLLAVVQLGLWYAVTQGLVAWPTPPNERWLFAGGLITLSFWLFSWIAPRLAFVQPLSDRLHLQTPFYRLEISYEDILSIVSVRLRDVLGKSQLRVVQRLLASSPLEIHALRLDLKALPPLIIKLRSFFGRMMIVAEPPGMLLVVEEWMALSVQLSSQLDVWRAERRGKPSWWGDDSNDLHADE
ncbi:MAG: hypothetical protein PVI78_00595 [Anaerolineales bacterium]